MTFVESNCKHGGLEERVCGVCGIHESRDTEIGDHTPETTYIENTCTRNGKIEERCSVCGKLLYSETIYAPGHAWSDWIVTREATCYKEGEKYKECANCHSTITTAISTPEHDFGEWTVTKKPTCEEPGIQTRYCQDPRCRYKETEEIESFGHEHFYIGKIAIDETHAGTSVCVICGEEKSNASILADNGIIYEDYFGTNTNKGNKIFVSALNQNKVNNINDKEHSAEINMIVLPEADFILGVWKEKVVSINQKMYPWLDFILDCFLEKYKLYFEINLTKEQETNFKYGFFTGTYYDRLLIVYGACLLSEKGLLNIYIENSGDIAEAIRHIIDVNEHSINNALQRANAPFTSTDIVILLVMKPDENGIWHASYDCWQQFFGFNELYDFFFDLGTYMNRVQFPFTYEGKELILWGWKGDYINLGIGAELGIYERLYINGKPMEHWIVNKENSFPMTLELYDNETQKYIIEKYEPEKPQWWITGFNPKEKRYGKFDPSVLTATFEVDFETKDKFEAFMKNKLDYENRTGCCIFDKPDTYVVQIVW